MADKIQYAETTIFWLEINWGIWKVKMEDVLYLHDLHDLIDGDGIKPSTVSEEQWKKMEDCFSCYEKSVGIIRTANGGELPICGVGSIRFRIFDGVVREVSGVRHIPSCAHNLISLGQLDRRGCSFETRGGVLRVKMGGRVVMRGMLDGNPYSLAGSVEAVFGKRMTVEEPSPQQGGEVNLVIAYDSRLENHVLDRGLHVDDAQGIHVDQVMGSGQVIDGCRLEKSTKTRWRSLWCYKQF